MVLAVRREPSGLAEVQVTGWIASYHIIIVHGIALVLAC